MTTKFWLPLTPKKQEVTRFFQYISYISLKLSKLTPPDAFLTMAAPFLLNIFQNNLGWGRCPT